MNEKQTNGIGPVQLLAVGFGSDAKVGQGQYEAKKTQVLGI